MKFSIFSDNEKDEIHALFTQTFSDSEGQTEGELIGSLVLDVMNETDDNDIFGFVATEDNRIVGCIFFTRLLFNAPVEAFLLAPVAVHSNYQGKKIGQELIRFGLDQLKQEGVEWVFTYGDPKFYFKVGFKHVPAGVAEAPFELSQPEGWLFQSLNNSEIAHLPGSSGCVKAFSCPDYW